MTFHLLLNIAQYDTKAKIEKNVSENLSEILIYFPEIGKHIFS